MDKNKAQNRIQRLREEISRLRFLYHTENDPNVTDDVYDSLSRELSNLLKKYPEYNDSNSSESRVAGKALDKFTKVKHEVRMFSIGNVFSEEELLDWEKRNLKLLAQNTKLDYFCELKLDGLAISVIYKNGEFLRGVTRGDGNIGEDVTENLKMVLSIPLKLQYPYPEYIEVRGEAIINKNILDKINSKNQKEGKPLFANSRNAAAGSLRQLDPKIVKERHLDFYAYEIAQIEGNDWKKYIDSHSQKHDLLKKLGFMVESHSENIEEIKKIPNFINKISKIRETLPFGIDGVVININSTKIFENLGVVGKDPRGIIAFKYPAERATTIVKDITTNVGRTGVLTPVAHFDQVLVAGSTVSKATLHNMDQIERLGLKIGDTVVIQKAGDVIPEVMEVLVGMRTGKEKKFKMPDFCPVCGELVSPKATLSNSSKSTTGGKGLSSRSEAKRGETLRSPISSVAYFCTNKNCPARNQRNLEHFVNAFQIYEIGPKIISRLKDEGLITDASDLFSLEKVDLSGLERFGEKSADNIINSIEEHKKIALWRFIYALGIVHVGEQTARDLADHFHTLSKLREASGEEINSIENIGPVVRESIVNYFSDKNNLIFIEKLFTNGVKIIEEKKKTGNFVGKVFVLTGTLPSMSREDAKKKIIENGGKVSSSVSTKIDFVLAGESAGSKKKEAQKFGVNIIAEEEFLKML